jgi:16S rRNA (adenine1518-N6/adenine1519-N6)-dimethyltransferase
MTLTSLNTVRELLNRYGLKPDKSFGQNFLVDAHALQTIVEAADITASDTVLEIGPGLGVLTRELAKKAHHVISVELDKRLIPVLNETLSDLSNITLIHGDGLVFDLSSLPKNSLMVANLPYNVATPLLVKALESGQFKRLVFLVQKEVAQRLASGKGSKSYGALSVVVQYFGQAKRLRDLSPGVFLPPPDITSSLVRLDIDTSIGADPAFFDFVHQAFRHRRKTLQNSLMLAAYDAEMVKTVLQELGFRPDIRAEALELTEFKSLFELIKAKHISNQASKTI